MRVIYVARHNSGGNDDEGAIAHALEELGCSVVRFQEGTKRLPAKADFCLFHKWDDVETMSKLDCPRVMWYFDLVNEPSTPKRSAHRKAFMEAVLPHVQYPFATDGDWCCEANLMWLPQGADGRIVGRGKRNPATVVPLLFTGGLDSSARRRAWAEEMVDFYGSKFCIRRGVYREQLRNEVAAASIVLAPPSPTTDKYWSNRVYVALGFGAFMLHPACKWLQNHYSANELQTYCSMDELHAMVKLYLNNSNRRFEMSEAALTRTKKEHLYLHRCEKLLEVVKRGNVQGYARR